MDRIIGFRVLSEHEFGISVRSG